MYNINIYFKLRNSNALLNSKILKLYHAPKVYACIKDLRSEVLRYHIPPCGKAVWKVNHFEKIFFQSELKKNQSALLMCINIFSSSEILWSPICLASVYLSVRCSVPYVCNLFTFFQDHWANFNKTWHQPSFGEGNSNLWKWNSISFQKNCH